MASSTVALIILVITVALFASGKLPLAVTAVGAALAMSVTGTITYARAFSGFSNDVTLMVLGSIVIGEALFETGVAQKIGTTIIKMVGTNEKVFMGVCIILSAVLSAFLSNTAVVAMMMPVIAATAANSNGKITKKNSYMAVGFAANVGGGMTLVGSTPNVIGQGLLADAGLNTMSFFDLTLGSIPRLLFMVIFYMTVGYKMQQKVFDFEDLPDNIPPETGEELTKKQKAKMVIAVAILVFAVVGFVTGIWTVGTVAMVAAILCIITGCISLKRVYETMDWATIWVMAGSIGLAAGISDSGAGQLIAETFIGFLNGHTSMFNILIIFTLLGLILGNLMTSTGTMAMLAPIAIAMCVELGIDAKPVIMAMIWAINLAFLTPTATVVITMTLQGGYRFTDYTKMGIPLTIGCLILTVAMYPIVFEL